MSPTEYSGFRPPAALVTMTVVMPRVFMTRVGKVTFSMEWPSKKLWWVSGLAG